MTKDLNDKRSVARLIEYMGRAQEQKIRLYVVWPGPTVIEPDDYREIDFLLHGYMGTMPLERASSTEIKKNEVMRELEAGILDSIKKARGKLEDLLGDEDN